MTQKSSWLLKVVFLLALTGYPSWILAQDTLKDEIVFQYVDPLKKVFRSTVVFPERKARAHVARGQHATFQFVIRSSWPLKDLHVSVEPFHSTSNIARRLKGAEVGYVGYVYAANRADDPARDRLDPVSRYYPDPIREQPPETLAADHSQPVWITLPIPKDVAAGHYEGKVVLRARTEEKAVKIERPIAARVYPPVVDSTRLSVTNWWRWRGIEGKDLLSYMNEGHSVETFSKRFWELLRPLAQTMADYRQNVAWISPLRLAKYGREDGRYQIDFSRFDRMVKLFIEEGVIGQIEGRHLAGRSTSDWGSDFHVYVPKIKEDTTIFEQRPITEQKARTFYRQFIPALVEHLKQKGWYDIYIQHIADEPVKENADSYAAIARFIKNLAPNIRLIDATLESELSGILDTWVPTLDGLDQKYNFYKKRQKTGDEVWFYTCVVPQDEYANRFLELPLIKTRLLHWINFRYGITGYLHWGFNHWGGKVFEEASERGLPAGDSWIVYPKKGGVIPSIRYEAMRQGIVDYELLKMLEARSPEKVKQLVREVVHGFDNYDTYVPAFRETRRRLLELLSKTITGRKEKNLQSHNPK